MLRALMNDLPDRIYFKDRESHFLGNSRSHAAGLGVADPAELRGKSDRDFFSEEHARGTYEAEQEIIRSGQGTSEEQLAVLANGEKFWALVTKLPFRDEDGQVIGTFGVTRRIDEQKRMEEELRQAYADVERLVQERTAELQREIAERERAQVENARLQQEIIHSQQLALHELSTPIIPIIGRILVMPLIGAIDTLRARDIMRALLTGIREHRAKVVILDITGVPLVDTAVANHLIKSIQAARLKGTRAIITGISDAVAETLVDLGVNLADFETLADLETGLITALQSMGLRLSRI
jgi:rsbT co-antagonist protein RsbR